MNIGGIRETSHLRNVFCFKNLHFFFSLSWLRSFSNSFFLEYKTHQKNYNKKINRQGTNFLHFFFPFYVKVRFTSCYRKKNTTCNILSQILKVKNFQSSVRFLHCFLFFKAFQASNKTRIFTKQVPLNIQKNYGVPITMRQIGYSNLMSEGNLYPKELFEKKSH